MSALEITLHVPDDVLHNLRQKAGERNVSLDVVVSELVAEHYEEPTEEEILAGIRQGMIDALSGNVQPADKVLVEIRQELNIANDS